MATQQSFQSNFIRPLVECYGQQRFPEIRVKALWEKLKIYPDHVLTQAVEKVILTFDNFPGVSEIMNTAGSIAGEYLKFREEELKASSSCFRCSSQGVIVANNYAYRCSCELGEICYPAYPIYEGQVNVQGKIYQDEEGNRIYEDGNYLAISPKNSKNIRDFKFYLKSGTNKQPQKPSSEIKAKRPSYHDFLSEK
jgi:hypothetical protein